MLGNLISRKRYHTNTGPVNIKNNSGNGLTIDAQTMNTRPQTDLAGFSWTGSQLGYGQYIFNIGDNGIAYFFSYSSSGNKWQIQYFEKNVSTDVPVQYDSSAYSNVILDVIQFHSAENKFFVVTGNNTGASITEIELHYVEIVSGGTFNVTQNVVTRTVSSTTDYMPGLSCILSQDFSRLFINYFSQSGSNVADMKVMEFTISSATSISYTSTVTQTNYFNGLGISQDDCKYNHKKYLKKTGELIWFIYSNNFSYYVVRFSAATSTISYSTSAISMTLPPVFSATTYLNEGRISGIEELESGKIFINYNSTNQSTSPDTYIMTRSLIILGTNINSISFVPERGSMLNLDNYGSYSGNAFGHNLNLTNPNKNLLMIMCTSDAGVSRVPAKSTLIQNNNYIQLDKDGLGQELTSTQYVRACAFFGDGKCFIYIVHLASGTAFIPKYLPIAYL